MSKPEPFVDGILHALCAHPLNLVITVLLIGSAIVSIPMAVIALILWPMLTIARKHLLWPYLLATGFVLAIAIWLLSDMRPALLFSENSALVSDYFRHLHYPHPAFLWLSAFPYALMIAAMLDLCGRSYPKLGKEVRRVAKGKQLAKKRLSPKKIAGKLAAISPMNDACSLGINMETGETATLSDKDANRHTLVLGTTGCGKTNTNANILQSAVDRGLPVVYIDGKGDYEFARHVKDYADRKGTPCWLFSMTGESDYYDPLATGDYSAKKDRIIELRNWSEDHYRKIAEGYLQTVFQILEEQGIKVDLHTLSKYMGKEGIDALYDLARKTGQKELALTVEHLEDHLKDITSLTAEIKNIANSSIGHLFNCSGKGKRILRLKDVVAQNGVAYFSLPALAFPAYASLLGKLIMNDLKSLLSDMMNQRTSKAMYAFLDEFYVYAGDQVINFANQGRGAGLHAVLSCQSPQDIARCGGAGMIDQIIDNMNNFIIQRLNHNNSAEMFAGILTTEERFGVTAQIDSRKGGSGVGTIRNTKEFIVHPDDIKRLPDYQGFYMNKREFKVQRVQFKKSSIL